MLSVHNVAHFFFQPSDLTQMKTPSSDQKISSVLQKSNNKQEDETPKNTHISKVQYLCSFIEVRLRYNSKTEKQEFQ